MKQGSRLALAVLVALTLGLAMGATGTASAAGLSKAAVKKIAAKVVADRASRLSVAHAATAGSATTAGTAASLGGATADQLRTAVWTFLLPQEAASNAREYHFPGLPAGSYVMAYVVSAQVGSAPFYCQVSNGGSPPLLLESYGVAAFPFSRTSATAGVTVTAATVLTCGTIGSGTTMQVVDPATQRSTVTFTRVDVTTPGTATSVAQ